jgi:prophage regulatory protein
MSLPATSPDLDRYVRLPSVLEKTGLSETTIYRLIKRGEFPVPNKLGAQAVGWKLSAVTHWCESRPEAREPQAA